jgi:hypothetical protein
MTETVAQAAELATVAPLKPAIDCKRVAGIGNRNAERWSNTDRPAPVEGHRANEAGVGDHAQVASPAPGHPFRFIEADHDGPDRSEPQHAFEFYRDIPRSCICQWLYRVKQQRWTRHRTAQGCVWHDVPRSADVRQP